MTDDISVILLWPGLLNPFAILIAAYMGYYSNQRAKIFIAGFAAAALSLFLEGAIKLVGIPMPWNPEVGPLALFPFRFATGLIVSAIAMKIGASRRRAK
ncbi:phosphatidylglycerophosphatase [Pseudovibrio brasiliensis]|uniref:Phosphatidylglycerophosphatase n=1 Tax=Pseudovibrio brasiliensis TaxID=1898042 RepID=A0ABX8AMZ3_9HYPH|nr:phosphatidylglycerophosphatase [Pseudovibrio brasiliensis]QUS54581.1 phosphatidylglycerophosphatase [Pseudovibrio brasiliensis]